MAQASLSSPADCVGGDAGEVTKGENEPVSPRCQILVSADAIRRKFDETDAKKSRDLSGKPLDRLTTTPTGLEIGSALSKKLNGCL
jgi:hypothetical protein